VGASIRVGKVKIKFDINSERSSFKFWPRFELCNMIKVNYIPPHRCVSKKEPRKKEELEKKEVKRKSRRLLLLSRSRNKSRLWRPKRWLSRRISLRQRWCRSGHQRMQCPQRLLIRRKQVKESSYGL
jgi:hypothetical protein